jgi:hypothetical protein
MSERPVFHLAYFSRNTQWFMSGQSATSQPLMYALVPVGIEGAGPWKLEAVTVTGRPSKELIALPQYLRSVRRPDVEGVDPVEKRLTEQLQSRAFEASYVLPGLALTERMPSWSKLVLPREVVVWLQQLGGAGDMLEVRG